MWNIDWIEAPKREIFLAKIFGEKSIYEDVPSNNGDKLAKITAHKRKDKIYITNIEIYEKNIRRF